MSDLKIIFNSRFATRPSTGVDRVASELIRSINQLTKELDKNRIELLMAMPSKPDINIEHEYINIFSASERIRRGRLPGQAWEQLELPFIHRQGWILNPCNVGPLIRQRQILIIHDAQVFSAPNSYSCVFRTWYKSVLPLLARRAEIVITVSEYSKTQLEHYNVIPKGKAHVIHNGVDHILRVCTDKDTLSHKGLNKNGYFLFVGSFADHKNLVTLIEAATARPCGEPELVIVGGRNSKPISHVKISSGQGVRVLGHVSDSQLKALYENALALAFPSLTEGFGFPPLEAMCCGCPVIATNAGATPEVCGDAPIYISPKKAQQWTEMLMLLSRNETLRKKIGEKGLLKAKQYTWRKSALQILALAARKSNSFSLLNAINCLHQ